VSVYDIKINADSGVTAVFTYGRGAYGIGFPSGPQITASNSSPANGATYVAGGLVPGSWAQVKGSNLSGTTRIWNDSDFVGLGNQLPTNLDGVEVKVNGISAAIYYISPSQITFQMPSGTLPGPPGTVLVSGPVTVQAFRDGEGGNAVSTTGTSSSPGIFPIVVNGKNYPAAVFLDGALVGDPAIGPAFRKARPGDVIELFSTGLFRTQSGVVPSPAPYSNVTVIVGNVTVAADAAVLISAGEFQINFTLPTQFASLPEGDYPISIQYGIPINTSSPAVINSDPPGPVVLPVQH